MKTSSTKLLIGDIIVAIHIFTKGVLCWGFLWTTLYNKNEEFMEGKKQKTLMFKNNRYKKPNQSSLEISIIKMGSHHNSTT